MIKVFIIVTFVPFLSADIAGPRQSLAQPIFPVWHDKLTFPDERTCAAAIARDIQDTGAWACWPAYVRSATPVGPK